MLPLRAKVDLGVMAMKWFSAFPKAPALLEPHHQIVLCHIQEIHWGYLTPLQRSSSCILQPTGQPIRFIFAPNFTLSRLESYAFGHTPLWIIFLNEFYDPFHCFNKQFFCWSYFLFQLRIRNLKSASTVF